MVSVMFKRVLDFSEFKKIPKTTDFLQHATKAALVVVMGIFTFKLLNGFGWLVDHVVPFAILRWAVKAVGGIAGLYYAGLAFQTVSALLFGAPDPATPAAAVVMPGSTENSSNDQV